MIRSELTFAVDLFLVFNFSSNFCEKCWEFLRSLFICTFYSLWYFSLTFSFTGFIVYSCHILSDALSLVHRKSYRHEKLYQVTKLCTLIFITLNAKLLFPSEYCNYFLRELHNAYCIVCFVTLTVFTYCAEKEKICGFASKKSFECKLCLHLLKYSFQNHNFSFKHTLLLSSIFNDDKN